ncbi:HupE/UreJ family protein [Collimonas antrihumi]|uniref:HupE/UreJ family protein n=1 Tax=Collimonas antrihumi TaxID=1940615 RepID=UPI001B8B984A|nr:HupE/UreJ family protein [Collimonas antrihumi]
MLSRFYRAGGSFTVIALSAWPSLAHAHAAFVGIGDFYAGVLHPITSPEHIMLLLALGLLAGQNGRQRCCFLLAVFPVAVLAGAIVSRHWMVPQSMFAINVSTVIAAGIFLAIGRQQPRSVLGLFAAFAGITFGMANGSAIEGQMAPAAFFSGMTAVAFLTLAYVTAAGDSLLRLRQGWINIGLRVAGSWAIAIGVLVLSLASRQWLPG